MPTVETNGIDTYYERRGAGPPIVFVHGMYLSTAQWQPQLDALGDDFTVVAYDVRGHGRTGGSDRERYDIDLFAADLDALLDALDIERPILCGLSMGGCIAQAYAATHPDSVRGLVLADTFAPSPMPLGARLLFANLRVYAHLDRVVRYPTLNRLQLRVGNLLSPGVGGDREAVQRVLEAGPTIPHDEFAKVAGAMARFPGTRIDLSRITVPTLLLHGEHLPRVMAAMHPRLAARLTAAPVEIVEVPDAGHASNVDNPAFFTDAVRGFAASVVPAQRSADRDSAKGNR